MYPRKRSVVISLITTIFIIIVVTTELSSVSAAGDDDQGPLYLPMVIDHNDRNAVTATATVTQTPPPTSTASPTPVATYTPTPNTSDFSSSVVELTNQERVQAGCSPLSINPLLTQAAQAHSEDMAARHYFSHYSPEGETPSDRMRKAGYVSVRAAENIAMGYSSPQEAVTAWMNSSGHRANILNCALREIGVGYAIDLISVPYWTQDFGTAPGALTVTPTPTRTAVLTPTPIPTPSGTVSPPSTDDMILIPAGTFQMGCDNGNDPDCHEQELPIHTVSLDSYYIDKYEVTNTRYKSCVDAGVCTAPNSSESYTRSSYYGNSAYADYPVINVDWYQAAAFCSWEGKRLPSEAEWEKAARGPNDTRVYPWGNASPTCDLVNSYVNGKPCVGDTTPVGSYPAGASPYGAMDMSGNVWEWVNDLYDKDYYSVSPVTNPPGPATSNFRGLRGGAVIDSQGLRLAYRGAYFPYVGYVAFGFRCAFSQ